MSEARIWYARDLHAPTLPDGFENEIVLTTEFYQEIADHPIPADLEAVRTLSASPAVLDLFTWLSYRCYMARGEERIPLFGSMGLAGQLGSIEYRRPRKFREKLEQWLRIVLRLWPECPARITSDGRALRITEASAIRHQP